MGRRLLLGCLVYGLFLLGLATLNGSLIALAIPLAIYMGASLLSGPEELRLRVSRTLSAERILEGWPVVVRLSVANEGSRLEEALVEDLVPKSVERIEGEPRRLVSLLPGTKVEYKYALGGLRRGTYSFQDVRVVASDHLGLFRRQATLPAPGQVAVLPAILKLRRVPIRPTRTRAYAGLIPARQGGSGVDFFGVREYRLGDPQRCINWRLSARHPRALFTNEFEQERIADVGLILDARQRSDVRAEGESLFEDTVGATASLAEAFLNDGNRVGLLVYGVVLDWTFPGYGKVQRERILRALARAEPGESMVFNSLDYLPTRFFPAQSQIVMVSPLFPDDLPSLIRLRARGYQLLVVSPNPVLFEQRNLVPHSSAALAARIAHVERRLLIRRLRQAGVLIVDWQTTVPFDLAIHKSLGRRPQVSRIMRVRQ